MGHPSDRQLRLGVSLLDPGHARANRSRHFAKLSRVRVLFAGACSSIEFGAGVLDSNRPGKRGSGNRQVQGHTTTIA